jgi:hypothetical protein
LSEAKESKADKNVAITPTLFANKFLQCKCSFRVESGNTKGGSITVPLTSCLTGLESAVWQLTIFIFICKTDYSQLVKQEANGTVILTPLVFPGWICCILIGKWSCWPILIARLDGMKEKDQTYGCGIWEGILQFVSQQCLSPGPVS